MGHEVTQNLLVQEISHNKTKVKIQNWIIHGKFTSLYAPHEGVSKGSALAELKPPDPFEFGTESGWIFSEFCRLLSDFTMSFFRELDFYTYFSLYRTLRYFLTVTLWHTINLKCSLTFVVWFARICHKSRPGADGKTSVTSRHLRFASECSL